MLRRKITKEIMKPLKKRVLKHERQTNGQNNVQTDHGDSQTNFSYKTSFNAIKSLYPKFFLNGRRTDR